MKKYFITTFGCQLNVHESEKIAGILEKMGYRVCESINEADVIVFNTCAIRGGAEERAFGNIGALKQLKKQNKEKIIVVCGCMSQQKQNADYIAKTFPFVDIILGTSNIHLLEQYINQRLQTGKRVIAVDENFNLDGESCAMYRTSGENAWVNIMQGCNNFCTYCIVPYVRGRERSRPLEDILNEIKDIVATKKFKKITLLGQNVNSYGNGDDINFARLLTEICKIDGDFKLTFMTSHPKDLTREVIDIIAKEDKILKEIHLPLQSGSNKILKLMNRKYTREKYLEIVDYIQKNIPNVRLTTDIIVGFPNETEEDFQQTCDIIEKVKYSGVFAFMYSKRAGTPAAEMQNQIDDEIKHIRVNKILKLAKEYKEEKN